MYKCDNCGQYAAEVWTASEDVNICDDCADTLEEAKALVDDIRIYRQDNPEE